MATTTIEALHLAWSRSGEIYQSNDRAATEAGDETSLVITDAMKTLDRQMIDISLVILREMPTSVNDALIVAKHMANAADLIAHSDPVADDGDMKALKVATENLLVFLVRHHADEAENIDVTYEQARVLARTVGRGA